MGRMRGLLQRRLAAGCTWALFLVGALLLGASCNSTPTTTEQPLDPPKKEYLNHGPDAKYVGKQACKSCHQDKFETFVHSEMGRSFKPAQASLSVAQWDHAKPVYDKFSDLYYLPYRVGEALFIREYRLQGRDTVHSRTEQVSYIVGSGQHTNSHMIEENGYVYQAPLTWYAQDGKWDLPPGFEQGHNSRFARAIELECMTCHNAMPEFEPGSDNRFVKIPDGVDCERCHGPGSIHIQEKQSGSTRHLIDGIDYTIVHPGKLSVERQFDICQRCHLQGTAVPVEGKTFMDFRPGMVLGDYINVFMPRFADSVSNFIMAAHPDRLRMSACFKASHADTRPNAQPMTCITCHNPHVSIETLGADHYRTVCQSCHAPESPNFCSAPPAQRAAQQDNCVSCHMPRSGSSDIPHVRITDHYIRKPEANPVRLSPVELQQQKEFVRLACLTQPQPSHRLMAEGYLAQFEQFTAKAWLLDSADARLRAAAQGLDEGALLRPLVRLRYLQRDYAALAALGQRHAPAQVADAWTAYRIGEACQAMGDAAATQKWFRRATDLAPGHLQFKNKLAAALIKDGQVEGALTLLNELVAAYGKDPSILNNRGFGYVLQQDMGRAETDFKRALALDPDNETAMANLASLYLNTQRTDEAKRWTQVLLRRDPENPQYLKLKSVLGMK